MISDYHLNIKSARSEKKVPQLKLDLNAHKPTVADEHIRPVSE